MSELIAIERSPAIHQKCSNHVSALDSSAPNLQAHSIAGGIEHLALACKRILNVNVNPRHEGVEHG